MYRVFEAHDRARVEVLGFAIRPHDEGASAEERARVEANLEHFVDVSQDSLDGVAQRQQIRVVCALFFWPDGADEDVTASVLAHANAIMHARAQMHTQYVHAHAYARMRVCARTVSKCDDQIKLYCSEALACTPLLLALFRAAVVGLASPPSRKCESDFNKRK